MWRYLIPSAISLARYSLVHHSRWIECFNKSPSRSPPLTNWKKIATLNKYIITMRKSYTASTIPTEACSWTNTSRKIKSVHLVVEKKLDEKLLIIIITSQRRCTLLSSTQIPRNLWKNLEVISLTRVKSMFTTDLHRVWTRGNYQKNRTKYYLITFSWERWHINLISSSIVQSSFSTSGLFIFKTITSSVSRCLTWQTKTRMKTR